MSVSSCTINKATQNYIFGPIKRCILHTWPSQPPSLYASRMCVAMRPVGLRLIVTTSAICDYASPTPCLKILSSLHLMFFADVFFVLVYIIMAVVVKPVLIAT